MSDTEEACGAHNITLVANLDLTAAAPLEAALLELRGKPAHIQGQDVERLGAQCLQVLLSASQTWAADDQIFTVSDISPAFADGLKVLGFDTTIFAQQESA